MNIYEVNSQIQQFLISHVDAETGELLGGENIISELEGLQLNLQEKQKNIILYYKNLEGEQDIIDAEIKRLDRLKSLNSRKRENLKKLLEESMRRNNETALDFTTVSAKFKKNPPKVIIEIGADVEKFKGVVIVEKIDKKAIKEAIEAGEEVKGCKLMQEMRLEIS